MNVPLLLVVLFLSANIAWGFVRGFLRVVYSMVGWILFSMFATYATPYVSEWVGTTMSVDATSGGMRALTFFIVLLIVAIAFQLLASAVGLAARLPLLGGINHLLGAAAGLVKGMFFVWLIFAVAALARKTSWGAAAVSAISDSPPLLWLYENNLLRDLLMLFLEK